MIRYLTRRLANYAVMIFISTSIAYFAAVSFMRPETRLLQRTPRPTLEAVKTQLRMNGLDPDANPVQRYLQWLGGVLLHFDWGLGPDGARVNDVQMSGIAANEKAGQTIFYVSGIESLVPPDGWWPRAVDQARVINTRIAACIDKHPDYADLLAS